MSQTLTVCYNGYLQLGPSRSKRNKRMPACTVVFGSLSPATATGDCLSDDLAVGRYRSRSRFLPRVFRNVTRAEKRPRAVERSCCCC